MNSAQKEERNAYLKSVQEVRKNDTLWKNGNSPWGVADSMEYNSRKSAIEVSSDGDSAASTAFTDGQVRELFDDPGVNSSDGMENW